MTQWTTAQRRQSAQQALALVAAGMDAEGRSDGPIADLIEGCDDLPLLVASLVGLTTGFLGALDERRPGAATRTLGALGLSFEMEEL